jgi:hypothetical protein
MRFTQLLVLLSVLASAEVALAEDPDGGVPPPTDPVIQPVDPAQDPNAVPVEGEPYEPGADPYAQPAPDPNAGAQPVPVVEEESAETGRGVQYGLHVVVPIYLLNHDGMDLNVGIGAQGRIGWEFGSGLSTELSIGVMYNGARDGTYDETLAGAPVTVTWEGYGLTTIWIGLGLRYAFLNPTAFVPFIGAGLMLPIWSNAFRNAAGGVTSEGDAVVSFGFNGLVGVQLEVSTQVGIEVGAQINYAIAPGWDQIYAAPELWLTPFAGVTLYF